MSGRVVVITGASAGVGRACAQAFARRGDAVALLARGTGRLESARRDVERLGARALVVPTDVADAAQVEGAAAQVEAELGPIDVWVNNAMATVLARLAELTPEEFGRVTDVTYLGTVHGTMAALARMRARDRGTIVQVGSALSYRAIPLQSAYCGAKHAVRGFTDALRCELLHERSRVRLTMVQLPALNTPQFGWCRTRLGRHPQPVPPIFQPEVAARAIVWAAEHDRREVVVGWPAVQAIWGSRLAPGLGDRILARSAFDDQQTDRPLAHDRPDNLFAPADGDQDAHGVFDDRARPHSAQWWLATHRPLMATLALGLAALLAAFVIGVP